MFRKALIPLDTSEAAERVIPYVKQIISKEETELLLVNATKPNMFRYAFPTHEPSLEAKLSATATDFRKRYLHRLLDSLIAQGVSSNSRANRWRPGSLHYRYSNASRGRSNCDDNPRTLWTDPLGAWQRRRSGDSWCSSTNPSCQIL